MVIVSKYSLPNNKIKKIIKVANTTVDSGTSYLLL